MPERNHEVIIDGFVFPDTVTVTLANDEYINSRDYVDKELYESISSANDYWQTENAKLREERREYQATIDSLVDECADHKAENAKLRELLQRLLTEYRYMRIRPRRMYLQHEGRMRAIEEEMRKLGVEVD